MKTTRTLIIICLVALLGIFATIPQTFSWFNRAEAQEGNALNYTRENIPVSNSAVTVTTVDYQMDGNSIALDQDTKAKLEHEGNSTRTTVSNSHMQYYKTTITNNNTTDAYVDLYMNGATNNSMFYVGTINPVITEKQVGAPARTVVSNPAIRIYFQLNDASDGDGKWYTSGQANPAYLYAKTGSSYPSSGTQLTKLADSYKEKGTGSDNIDTYYADLPANTVDFFISKSSTLANATGFARTRSVSTFVPGTLYYLTGRTTDDDNNYAEFLTYKMGDGLYVPSYYTDVYTAQRRSVYLKLPVSSVGEITYSVGDGLAGIIEINANTGRAKVYSTDANGEKVTTTVTGPLGSSETQTFQTTIHVDPTVNNFPIARNVFVPHGQSKVVEWYIHNKLSTNTTTQSMGYTSIYYTI